MAQQPDLSQSGLVGKLENPTIVTDSAQWPKQFQEAPALAELVKVGKLPPVEQRLPQEPMVIKPLRSVGKYGGTWRRGFLGPGDSENGNRVRSGDKLLFWDVTGTKIVPNVAKGWEIERRRPRTTTLFLRKGMKWSDGAPFTADDFVFWYEDMYQNKDLDQIAGAGTLRERQARPASTKVDETTVRFEFDDPHFLFPSQLAGDTQVGGGQSRLQSDERELGLYAPAHYLKQFLPKYSSVDALNQQAKAAGFDNWAQVFKIKSDWRLNPDVPTLSAWRMVQPINGQTWLLERNAVFLGRRYDGQPVALSRQGPADVGRESGSDQSAGDRRRVRLHGAFHRSRQTSRVPGERHSRQLQGPSRSRFQRLRLRAEVQLRLSRWIPRSRNGSPISSSAARWRSASTASRSTRRSSSAWA